jgi:hypothetical protein
VTLQTLTQFVQSGFEFGAVQGHYVQNVVESHTWKTGRDILLQLHDEFAELLDRVFIVQTGSFQSIDLPLKFANLNIALL